MSLIGIDVGTTGCKVGIYSHSGRMLGMYSSTYSLIIQENHIELLPELVWSHVVECLRNVVSLTDLEDVTGISVSAMSDTFMMIDKEGVPIGPSIVSFDNRAEAEKLELVNQYGEKILYDKTGIPIHSMHPACKILWLKKHNIKQYKQVWKYMGFEEYILFRLGAKPMISYSSACRTMLLNINTMTWDPELLSSVGVLEEQLPEVCESGQVIGYLDTKLSKELGLSKEVALVSGGFDQACCALGTGITENNHILDTTGTNGILFFSVESEKKNTLLNNSMSYSPHILSNKFCTFTQITNAGGALRWFRDLAYGSETSYSFVCDNMQKEPTGLIFLPFLNGVGTPEMSAIVPSAFWGMTLSTDRGQMAKAILEGVTYELALQLKIAQSFNNLEINTITCVGGAALSPIWMQIKADITGLKVKTFHKWEAGTAGAAALAGVGVGVFKTFEEASNSILSWTKTVCYEPNLVQHEKYIELANKYDRCRALAVSIIKETVNNQR